MTHPKTSKSEPPHGKRLIYTVALDRPGERWQSMMARLMVASVLRSGYDGDIAIFHDRENLLFEHGRSGVTEIRISEADLPNESHRKTAHRLKYSVRSLYHFSDYDRIMFLDADCLAFRDPTSLMNNPDEITYQVEPGMPVSLSQFNGYLTKKELANLSCDGANSGTFVVSGSEFSGVMEEWERIDCTEPFRGDVHHEQGAWNRLILDQRWSTAQFPDGSISFPYFPFVGVLNHGARFGLKIPLTVDHPMLQHFAPDYICRSVIAHVLGPMPHSRRLAMMFGLYSMRYFADTEMTLFHLLDP